MAKKIVSDSPEFDPVTWDDLHGSPEGKLVTEEQSQSTVLPPNMDRSEFDPVTWDSLYPQDSYYGVTPIAALEKIEPNIRDLIKEESRDVRKTLDLLNARSIPFSEKLSKRFVVGGWDLVGSIAKFYSTGAGFGGAERGKSVSSETLGFGEGPGFGFQGLTDPTGPAPTREERKAAEFPNMKRRENQVDSFFHASPHINRWREEVAQNIDNDSGNIGIDFVLDGLEATAQNGANLGLTWAFSRSLLAWVPYLSMTAQEGQGMLDSATGMGITDSPELRDMVKPFAHAAGMVEYAEMLTIMYGMRGRLGKGKVTPKERVAEFVEKIPFMKKVLTPYLTSIGVNSLEEAVQGGLHIAFLKKAINAQLKSVDTLEEINFRGSVFNEDGTLDIDATWTQLWEDFRIGGAMAFVTGGLGTATRGALAYQHNRRLNNSEYIKQVKEQLSKHPEIQEDGTISKPEGKLDRELLFNWLLAADSNHNIMEMETRFGLLDAFAQSIGYKSTDDFIAENITIEKDGHVGFTLEATEGFDIGPVFHGTDAAFDTFELRETFRDGEKVGPSAAFFFSESPELAEAFSINRAADRGVSPSGIRNIPARLRLANPLDLTKKTKAVVEILRKAGATEEDLTEVTPGLMWNFMDDAGVVKGLQKQGYDGAIFSDEDAIKGFGLTRKAKGARTFAVFDVKNIKTGTFGKKGISFEAQAPFFSGLQRAFEGHKDLKNPPKISWLLNQPGVKEAELELTNFYEWFDIDPDTKKPRGVDAITTEEWQEFNEANSLEIEETTLRAFEPGRIKEEADLNASIDNNIRLLIEHVNNILVATTLAGRDYQKLIPGTYKDTEELVLTAIAPSIYMEPPPVAVEDLSNLLSTSLEGTPTLAGRDFQMESLMANTTIGLPSVEGKSVMGELQGLVKQKKEMEETAPFPLEAVAFPETIPETFREIFITAPGVGIRSPSRAVSRQEITTNTKIGYLLPRTQTEPFTDTALYRVEIDGETYETIAKTHEMAVDRFERRFSGKEPRDRGRGRWTDGHRGYEHIKNPIARIRLGEVKEEEDTQLIWEDRGRELTHNGEVIRTAGTDLVTPDGKIQGVVRHRQPQGQDPRRLPGISDELKPWNAKLLVPTQDIGNYGSKQDAQYALRNALMARSPELKPKPRAKTLKLMELQAPILSQIEKMPTPLQKNWTKMALRRLVIHAIQNGYDRIELPSGKEITDLMGGEQGNLRNLYDKTIPNILKKWGKKFDSKIEVEGEGEVSEKLDLLSVLDNLVAEGIDSFTFDVEDDDVAGFGGFIEGSITEYKVSKTLTLAPASGAMAHVKAEARIQHLEGDFSSWRTVPLEVLVDAYERSIKKQQKDKKTFFVPSEKLKKLIGVQGGRPIFEQLDASGMNSKGQITFTEMGALIELFEGNDFTTLLEEFSHLFARHLNPENTEVLGAWTEFYTKQFPGARKQLEERLGIPESVSSKWSPKDIINALINFQEDQSSLTAEETQMVTAAQELFAGQFKLYITDPKFKAPTKRLKGLFEKNQIFMRKFFLDLKKGKFSATTIPFVESKKIHPDMENLFNSIMVADGERFGGEIVTGGGVAALQAEDPAQFEMIKEGLRQQKGRFPVSRQENHAVIKIAIGEGKVATIRVDNIIRGERPTTEQKNYLGKDVRWQSPLDGDTKLNFEQLTKKDFENLAEEKVPYDWNFLSKLTRKELDRFAKRIGIESSRAILDKVTLIEHMIEFHRAKMADSKTETEEWDAYLIESIMDSSDLVQKISLGGVPAGRWLYTSWAKGYSRYIIQSGGTVSPFSRRVSQMVNGAIDKSKSLIGRQMDNMLRVQILSRNIRKKPRKGPLFKKTGEKHNWINPDLKHTQSTAATHREHQGEKIIGPSKKAGTYTIEKGPALLEPDNYEGVFDDTEASPELLDLIAEEKALYGLQGMLAEKQGMKITLISRVQQEDGTFKREKKKVLFKARRKEGFKNVSTEDLEEHMLAGRFPRAATDEFWMAMMDTDSGARNAIAMALSDLNSASFTFNEAKQELEEFHKSLMGKAENRPINMEMMRIFKRVPASVWVPRPLGGTKKIRLYETDPFLMAEREVPRVGDRLGFISQFGQNSKDHNAIARDFVNAGHRLVDLQRVFRALNGAPMFTLPPTFGMGHPALLGYRLLNANMHIWKAGQLTNILALNIPETLALMSFGGPGRYTKVLGRMIGTKLTVDTALANDMRRQQVALGSKSESLFNLAIRSGETWDKTVEEFARQMGELTLKVTGGTWITALNELLAGLLGTELANDGAAYRAGDETKITLHDMVRMEILGFTPIEVDIWLGKKELSTKEETDAELQRISNAISTRMPALTQGTNLRPAERSKFANHPLWKFIYTFDSFAMMRTARIFEQIHEMATLLRPSNPLHQGKTEEEKKKNKKEIGAKIAVASEFFFMTGVAAGAAVFLRNLTTNPTGILGIADWDDEDEIPVDFSELFVEFGMMGWMSGPSQSLLHQTERGEGNIANILVNSISTKSMVHDYWEFVNYFWGEIPGKQPAKGSKLRRELNGLEASLRFLQRQNSVSKPINMLAMMTGIGSPNIELDHAFRRHRAFVQKFAGKDPRWRSRFGGEVIAEVDESLKFHRLMKKATSLMSKSRAIEGKQSFTFKHEDLVVELNKILQEADLYALDNNSVRSSLKGKRVIRKVPTELLEEYVAFMPDKSIEVLREYDALLDWVADGISNRGLEPGELGIVDF